MVKHIEAPARLKATGHVPKVIEEFAGRLRTGDTGISIARMVSPGGWEEPGQTPEFDEYTVVLRGILRVATEDGTMDVGPGKAVYAPRGCWVRYSTPDPDGAEYIAVCVPAFSPELVHRDVSDVTSGRAAARLRPDRVGSLRAGAPAPSLSSGAGRL